MAPRWEDSSAKHGVPRTDAIFAMLHANYIAEVESSPDGGQIMLYIGPEHAQTERELEILVNVFRDGREASIFHVMPLGPKYRRYREEHPDG